MKCARNGGATAPAVDGRIIDFEFALAAEAADHVDFSAHLRHRDFGAGRGHWGADGPTAGALGKRRSSEQCTGGQQHGSEGLESGLADDHYEPMLRKVVPGGRAALKKHLHSFAL